MNPSIHGVRSPVKRESAERYVLISLVSFAASVSLTRFFLQVAGYPQIGNSELHIAHVLWGGLLLFVAALLPLILANRWAFNTSAILSGVGVGLFIDEVGKFITQSNDYFYPPAAPIIYALFLLTVLLYLRVRRPAPPTPRSELYRILEELTEVLDHDLDPIERTALEARLLRIAAESEDNNLKRLAYALVSYLEEEQLHLVQPKMNLVNRLAKNTNRYIQTTLTQPRLKLVLVISLGGMGVVALIELVLLLAAIPAPQPAIESLIAPLVTSGELHSATDAVWFFVRTILEGGTGILLIGAGWLLATGQERRGIHVAILILIVWLTVINLLVFYLDQFGAVVGSLYQFLVLLGLLYYRRKFLSIHPESIQPEPVSGPPGAQ